MQTASYLEEMRAARRAEYAALLYAKPALRDDLAVLHAFDMELTRIPLQVTQAIAGAMRFQWWRDAIGGSDAYEANANPLARALRDIIVRHGLPLDALHRLIDARMRDIDEVPFVHAGDIEIYGSDCFGVMRQCAAHILGAQKVQLDHAVKAEGFVDVLMRFHFEASRGICLLPQDVLRACALRPEDIFAGPVELQKAGKAEALQAVLADLRQRAAAHWREAQGEIAALPLAARPAALTLALIPKRIARLERRAATPFAAVDVSPLRQLWTIWRAAR